MQIVISCKCRYFCCQWSCRMDNKKLLQVRSCPVENLRMNDPEMHMLLIVSFSNIDVNNTHCSGFFLNDFFPLKMDFFVVCMLLLDTLQQETGL